MRKPLGEILIEMGCIDEEQLNKALEYQKENKCRLGRALQELGFVDREDIFKALIKQYNYPYVDLKDREIDENIINLATPELVAKYGFIPFDYDAENDIVSIAMSPPFDLSLIENIQQEINKKINCVLTTPEQLNFCMKKYYFFQESDN